jgi:hypothetical protein
MRIDEQHFARDNDTNRSMTGALTTNSDLRRTGTPEQITGERVDRMAEGSRGYLPNAFLR